MNEWMNGKWIFAGINGIPLIGILFVYNIISFHVQSKAVDIWISAYQRYPISIVYTLQTIKRMVQFLLNNNIDYDDNENTNN